jgi:hypothetical protein
MGHNDGFKVARDCSYGIGKCLFMAFMSVYVVRWMRSAKYIITLYKRLCEIALYKDLVVDIFAYI